MFAEKQRNSQPARAPNSDWMPFPTLIAALSKFLPRDAIEAISKCHIDFSVSILFAFFNIFLDL